MATIVAFHAHPDDETLLTGGTLTLLAARGHRTVLVAATDGHVDEFAGPIAPRLAELHAAAAALGVARVAHLGYADSGHGAVLYPDPPGRVRFVHAELDAAAARLATILREEEADVLLSYDVNGGYRHRDHVRVHEVGRRAAELAGVARVLDATVPREGVQRLLRVLGRLRMTGGYDADELWSGYLPRHAITHRVPVRRAAARRKRALAAHRSVVTGSSRFAFIATTLLRMPAPLLGLVMRWEWYAEEGAVRPDSGPLDDILIPAPRAR
jgi:LmbE family N-acetylglucosaminyl deacetylase